MPGIAERLGVEAPSEEETARAGLEADLAEARLKLADATTTEEQEAATARIRALEAELARLGAPADRRQQIADILSGMPATARKSLAAALGISAPRIELLKANPRVMTGDEFNALWAAITGGGEFAGLGGGAVGGGARLSPFELKLAAMERANFVRTTAEDLGLRIADVLALWGDSIYEGVDREMFDTLIGRYQAAEGLSPAELAQQEFEAERRLEAAVGTPHAGVTVERHVERPAEAPQVGLLPAATVQNRNLTAEQKLAVARQLTQRKGETQEAKRISREKDLERQDRIRFLEGLKTRTPEQEEELRRLKEEVAAAPGQFQTHPQNVSPAVPSTLGPSAPPVGPKENVAPAIDTEGMARTLLSWALAKARNRFDRAADLTLEAALKSIQAAGARARERTRRDLPPGAQFAVGADPLAAAARRALELLAQLGLQGNRFAAMWLRSLMRFQPNIPTGPAPTKTPGFPQPPFSLSAIVARPGQFAVAQPLLGRLPQLRSASFGFIAPTQVVTGGPVSTLRSPPGSRPGGTPPPGLPPGITPPPGLPPGIKPPPIPGLEPEPEPGSPEAVKKTIQEALDQGDPAALAALNLARALGIPWQFGRGAETVFALLQNPALLAGTAAAQADPAALQFLIQAAEAMGVSAESFRFQFERLVPTGQAQLVTVGF